MSQGALIIEAKIKSGSLITARLALESNRDVFAVPGPITSDVSEGPNELIKQGAIPVTKPEDILEVFGKELQKEPKEPFVPKDDTELVIYKHLSKQPIHIDEIARSSELETDVITRTITLLEMKGVVRHEGGQFYTRVQ